MGSNETVEMSYSTQKPIQTTLACGNLLGERRNICHSMLYELIFTTW